MNTKQFRAMCTEILVPLLTEVFERRMVDMHDVLDIASNEIMRIGDRLDDIDAHLCRTDDAAE